MAQVWHKRREQLAPDTGAEAKCWRASEYKVDELADPAVLEAAPGATWTRFTPFGSYKPASKAREVEAGPHLMFLKLKGVMEDQPELFHKALVWFARKYGLLGPFEEDYLPHPEFPEGKALVAPEAVIDGQGRIRRVDPATEGKELLKNLLEPRGWAFLDTEREAKHRWIALPSELKFTTKKPGLDSEWWPTEARQLVPWEQIREDFGALLILDEEAFKGVSVLCTREPLRRWMVNLLFFPSGDTPAADLVSGAHNSFNSYLEEVSPRVVLGEAGNLERGWHCRNLLQAMYVMLYLDLTSDNTIKKCQSRGCPNYFRVGPQSKSRYCSMRCANRASTRMRRGQKP